MITEQDLVEAIAECEGTPRPNANTCIKLAAYYTIYNEMFGNNTEPSQKERVVVSNEPSTIYIESGTEFSRKVNGKRTEEVLPIIDELMETLMLINPRLYNSVIQKF